MLEGEGMYVSFASVKPYNVTVAIARHNVLTGDVISDICTDDYNKRQKVRRKWQHNSGCHHHRVVPVQRQLNGYADSEGQLKRLGPPPRKAWGSQQLHIAQDIPRHALRFEITPFDMGDHQSGYVSVVIETPSGKVHLPAVGVQQTCGDLKAIPEKRLGQHCMQDAELFDGEDRLHSKSHPQNLLLRKVLTT